MSRRLRFAPPNHWLHITQRGKDKQRIFLSDPDRQHFLDLLEQRSEERQVRIAGYAIMSNHYHLVAKGEKEDAISLFMMDVSGLYATYRNKTHHHTGRVLQGRFYAAVLGFGGITGFRARASTASLGITRVSELLIECRFGHQHPAMAEGEREAVQLAFHAVQLQATKPRSLFNEASRGRGNKARKPDALRVATKATLSARCE